MLRSTTKISFTELYMECSTRRCDFFKRLDTLIHFLIQIDETIYLIYKFFNIILSCYPPSLM
ncbi:MAG: hypothetical protein ACMUEL_03080 [Flavobacteriales bacterium Tduv]